MFFFDALLYGGEGIGHGRQGSPIDAQVVIIHPTVNGILAALDRAVAQQVKHQLGEDILVVLQVEVNAAGGGVDGAFHVVSKTIPQRWQP